MSINEVLLGLRRSLEAHDTELTVTVWDGAWDTLEDGQAASLVTPAALISSSTSRSPTSGAACGRPGSYATKGSAAILICGWPSRLSSPSGSR